MLYQEFIPARALQPYVKCYYLFDSETDTAFNDRAFATGCVELMFNLGGGHWQTDPANGIVSAPPVELWGQIIQPLPITSVGRNTMLGIRFFPHTASLFIHGDIHLFNDRVTDYSLVAGKPVQTLHARLQEAGSLNERIELIDAFLLNRYLGNFKKHNKVALVTRVAQELKQDDFFERIHQVASRYGITSRYLQKLFLQHTGLSPKLYHKINRFQNSLLLVAQKDASLTSIAYECGYFDQSHFIREFKSFTGVSPSAYIPENSTALLASPNK